ncbi:hypothetical protein HWV00_13820 [Moritella sp. 24]|uniref:hypothetical protein n=1 Tax=Moritella sp. 24 TaxID=2746230 RepID=UPI001BADF355|nr:hypothetical protein [Moritella sp. 24]QUM77222.1 hypothetical protein HWV00_13820 [Moritella sp. 24]
MKKIVLIMLCTTLYGCGGGDDETSNSTSLSMPITSLSLSSNGTESVYSTIPFTINQKDNSTIYIGALETGSTPIIQYMNVYQTAENSGELSLSFEQGYKIGEGLKTTTVDFYACYDENCQSQIEGSPVSINISMSVTLDESITTNKTETIEISTDTDAASQYVTIDDIATLASAKNDNLYFNVRDEHQYLDNITTTVSSHNLGLNLRTMDPSDAGFGVHSGSVTIDACYDYDCVYPIKGSPVSYNINYNVNYEASVPDGSVILNTTKLSTLNHNVLEAEYIDNADIVVMTSSTPDNAVYIYDTKNNTSQKIPLTRPATSLAVDNISAAAKIAVGHDALVTVINYDNITPSASDVITLASTSHVYDLAIKGDYVWISPYQGQWVNIETIEISTNSIVKASSSLRHRSLLKIHPTGEYLYTMTTDTSPRDIAKTDLSDPLHPVELYDSPYHGDYNIGADFWYSNNGQYIYTKSGTSFRATEDRNTDMTYAGTLPLMVEDDSNWISYYDISHIESSNDNTQLVLIDDPASGTLRYIDSGTIQQTHLFTLENTEVDTVKYRTNPLYAFYNNSNQLFIISVSNLDTGEQYSLLQVQ